MKPVCKIGDLIRVNSKKTLFWKNSDSRFSPDFENATVPKQDSQMVGVIVGSDINFVYIQILSNERIFWVAESSLSIIDSE